MAENQQMEGNMKLSKSGENGVSNDEFTSEVTRSRVIKARGKLNEAVSKRENALRRDK